MHARVFMHKTQEQILSTGRLPLIRHTAPPFALSLNFTVVVYMFVMFLYVQYIADSDSDAKHTSGVTRQS